MKLTLIIAWIALTAIPVRAQLFGPESLGGALLGGVAGGIIGHNSSRHTAEGIAIGAGAGLVLGALAGDARRERECYYDRAGYAYAYPDYYGCSYRRPSYALSGAVLGGVAGGIIGHNSGGQTAEGAAIGAGAGLLLGGLAEQSARRRDAARFNASRRVVYPTVSYSSAPTTAVSGEVQVGSPDPPQSATGSAPLPAGNTSSAAMRGANSLFGR